MSDISFQVEMGILRKTTMMSSCKNSYCTFWTITNTTNVAFLGNFQFKLVFLCSSSLHFITPLSSVVRWRCLKSPSWQFLSCFTPRSTVKIHPIHWKLNYRWMVLLPMIKIRLKLGQDNVDKQPRITFYSLWIHTSTR